jgi:hypothetical protein
MLTFPPLVVVTDLDVPGVTIHEAKADAPLIIHRDCVLPRSIALERVHAIPRRYPEIVETRREVHVLEFPDRPPDDLCWQSPRGPFTEQVAGAPVREGPDHREM